MFLDEMSTDLEPADYKLVARSLIRKLKRERARNNHLYQLLRERNAHLKRLKKVADNLRKQIKTVEIWELMTPWKKLWLMAFGKVNTGFKFKKPDESDWRPLYAFKCDKHGIVQDCPQSAAENLSCPKCLKEKEEK